MLLRRFNEYTQKTARGLTVRPWLASMKELSLTKGNIIFEQGHAGVRGDDCCCGNQRSNDRAGILNVIRLFGGEKDASRD